MLLPNDLWYICAAESLMPNRKPMQSSLTGHGRRQFELQILARKQWSSYPLTIWHHQPSLLSPTSSNCPPQLLSTSYASWILSNSNWRQLNNPYEDNDYGSTSASIVPALNNALWAMESEIISHVACPPLDSDQQMT